VPPSEQIHDGGFDPYYGEPQFNDGYPAGEQIVPPGPTEVPGLPELQSRNVPHTRRPSSDVRESVARAASRNAAGRRSGSRESRVRQVSSRGHESPQQPVRSAKFESAPAPFEPTAASPQTTVERDEWVKRYLEKQRARASTPERAVEEIEFESDNNSAEFDPFADPAATAKDGQDDEFDFSQFEE